MSAEMHCCTWLLWVSSNVQLSEGFLPPLASCSKAFICKQLMGEREQTLGEENCSGHSFVFALQNLRLFDCRNLLLFLLLQYFLLRFSSQQHCFIACHCHHLLLCMGDSRAHLSVLSYTEKRVPFFFLGSFRSAEIPRKSQGCSR